MWEQLAAQFLALATFFAFPALQYVWLRRFSRHEGRPELWYLPRYGFRLVVRNMSGRRTLSEIRYRTILRHVVPADAGSSVHTFVDTLLVEREDFFLFPGTDQVLLCFRLERALSGELMLVQTDKLGSEQARFTIHEDDCVMTDYSGNVENLFNFDVKLAKRAEVSGSTLIRLDKTQPREEQEFPIDRIRNVG